ncbi:hypothetical protein BOTBODRAFT_273753 [Botryobasidium botryosum FD-172 SS1]|uniref:Uncharacterized protein n=1 Tax=Botryobasidium botryosum (strain FD-172 SS1) TaxID=930990 RepID=A0A067MJB6_BOTB1|nr:hypothetical protein BOTBODRAFT_273753 [Botryobasidium botryosum FD-172 SS1]
MFYFFFSRFDYHPFCPFFFFFYRNEPSIFTGVYFMLLLSSSLFFPFSLSIMSLFLPPHPSPPPPVRRTCMHLPPAQQHYVYHAPAQYSIPHQIADSCVRLGSVISPRSIRSRPFLPVASLSPSPLSLPVPVPVPVSHGCLTHFKNR